MLAERAQHVRIGHRRLLILRITVVALAPILGEAIERALILWQLGALGEAARHLADAVASGEGERARKHGGAGYERAKDARKRTWGHGVRPGLCNAGAQQ
jgi:hypothetical protein